MHRHVANLERLYRAGALTGEEFRVRLDELATRFLDYKGPPVAVTAVPTRKCAGCGRIIEEGAACELCAYLREHKGAGYAFRYHIALDHDEATLDAGQRRLRDAQQAAIDKYNREHETASERAERRQREKLAQQIEQRKRRHVRSKTLE